MIFHAYLTAYFFWLALALGCLSILMIHNLAGGYWGAVLRRPLEAAAGTLPLLAVLFIPILLGSAQLYPWLHGDLTVSPEAAAAAQAAPHLDLSFKAWYLNTPFVIGRAVVYFAIWILLALLLIRWSRERDHNPSPALTARMRNVSAPGLILVTLTVTFASIDWLMSLDPAWTSSIWGLIVATGALLSGFAFAILVVVVRTERGTPAGPFAAVASPALFNSLGSLLLAFLMLWAYMSISQVILYYAGNLPEETIWYVRRISGGWSILTIAVAVLQFIIPFALLIFRGVKRSGRLLGAAAALIVFAQFVNDYWLVQPTFNDNTVTAGILTAVFGAVLGAVWLAAFLWQYRRAPEISPSEPKLAPAIEEHEAYLERIAGGAMQGERAHE